MFTVQTTGSTHESQFTNYGFIYMLLYVHGFHFSKVSYLWVSCSSTHTHSSFKNDEEEEEEGKETKRGKTQRTLSASEITVIDHNLEEASVDDTTSSTSCTLQNLGPLSNLQKYI
jgi:hypothetical protein